ncbi:MAG: hypothetical protein EOP04_29915 [Proteobacteria bacterium]|nr:MAG: hypothetical protein EOP04_29915 [Pseudomonadota bacterium]
MLVKVGNSIVDPDATPVGLIFRDDAERIRIAEQILAMAPNEGERWYAQVPGGMDRETFEKWATLNVEDGKVTELYDLGPATEAFNEVLTVITNLKEKLKNIPRRRL